MQPSDSPKSDLEVSGSNVADTQGDGAVPAAAKTPLEVNLKGVRGLRRDGELEAAKQTDDIPGKGLYGTYRHPEEASRSFRSLTWREGVAHFNPRRVRQEQADELPRVVKGTASWYPIRGWRGTPQ